MRGINAATRLADSLEPLNHRTILADVLQINAQDSLLLLLVQLVVLDESGLHPDINNRHLQLARRYVDFPLFGLYGISNSCEQICYRIRGHNFLLTNWP